MPACRWILLGGLLLILPGLARPAVAHGVRHEVRTREATVIRLVYHDGTPFARERVEIHRRGAERAYVVGETDPYGHFAFVADGPGAWECRAFSKDGHGGRFEFELPAPASAETDPDDGEEEPRRDEGD